MNTITILMSTYNGSEYLREQIESLINQEDVNVNIFVRDDGSSDNTVSLLEEYKNKGHLLFQQGTNIGWRNSFMELIYNSPSSDYYAFCDQDDIWMSNKIKVAIERLQTLPQSYPNLYCSNLRYYKEGIDLGLVQTQKKKLSLQFALMRSLAAGCTMVFNKELRDILKNNRPQRVAAHDFWTYQVASLLGNVYYDLNSFILYRQHNNNQIGASLTKKDIWRKRIRSAKKHFYENDRQNAAMELLRLFGHKISPQKRTTVEKVAYFNKNFITRLKLFFDPNFTMGSFANDFWLRIRILFGRI